MGCNSHLTVEVRSEFLKQSRWETYALDVPESRNYWMYELMAGVRGEEENALVAPRGVPADISREAKTWVDRWDGDGHSHSYLTAEEFRNVITAYRKKAGTDLYNKLDNDWEAVTAILNILENVYGKDNARLVFFFDN